MFSRFFIERPIFAAVISIVVMLGGGVAAIFLPVEQTPNITPPTVVVRATYPGASADVLAETVAVPIEEQVNGVENMLYMSSKSSSDGTMELTVTFEVGTDIDMAQVLVQNRVALAQPKLPEEVNRQGVSVQKQSTAIVLIVNLISPDGRFDEIYLSNYINTQIKDVISRVPGVGSVNIFGAKDYGMRIWLNPAKMEVRGLTTMDVIDAIREQNVQVAAGQIGAPPSPPGQVFQYTVNTQGRLTDVAQFENMILRVGSERRVLRVKDVARVELGAQSYNSYAKLDGRPTIAVGVYQLPGSNALSVADGVRGEMQRLQESFPEGLRYEIVFDTTRFVTASIAEVMETLVIAIILVVLTVYVFLQDWRTTLIPSVTIPVSLIGTMGVMLLLGMSINTLSLFGLVLAIGIVVDDAIVVVENVMRLIDEEGLSAKEASRKAMDQVTGPVIATTLVLLAVFVPTAMMSGITGRLYQQFAITIATATVFSSINALTLSPALCGVLLRPTPQVRGWFFTLFNRGFDRSTGIYSRMVQGVVRRTALMMLLFAGMLALTLWGFVRVPGGFIPDEDQGYFFISVRLPDGATLERTQAVTDHIAKMVGETPGIAHTIGIAGFSILEGLNTTNASTFFVVLEPWEERRTRETQIRTVIISIQKELFEIEEAVAFAFVPPAIQGLGNAGGFEFQLQDRGGAGSSQLETIATDIIVAGESDHRLVRMNNNLRTTVPQLYLDIDRTKAKRLQVPLQSIFTSLQANLGSIYVNDFNKFGRVYKVMVQADAEYRSKIGDIRQLEVRSATGHMVPLAALLKVDDTAGPQTIFHFNLYPSATITGQAAPGLSSGQAIDRMEQLAAEKLPPATFGYEWSGMAYQQIRAGNQAPYIFLMAAVFVYLFLAAQYESWSIPLSVIFSVPLALLGAIGCTMLRGYDNNIYTQIGLVLLIGLASKSAILIVEFAKQLRSEGKPIQEAALLASQLRFRAILMTAFSFILGVLPLLIATGAGAASRRTLGTAVAGGMTLATLLGVVMIPGFYVVVQRASEKLRNVKDKS